MLPVTVPLNGNGAVSYSRETGDPWALPIPRQSLAVNRSGTLVGTAPSATVSPFTFNVICSGPAGCGYARAIFDDRATPSPRPHERRGEGVDRWSATGGVQFAGKCDVRLYVLS